MSDERYLWPEYRRIYNEIEPTIIVNENVPGTISNGILDKKISDLEVDGYTCWPPILIPSGAGDAFHRRNRIFLVAYTYGRRCKQYKIVTIKNKKEKRKILWDPIDVINMGCKARIINKSGIIRMAHGIPGQLDGPKRIRALGNAVDPRIAYQIFKMVNQFIDKR